MAEKLALGVKRNGIIIAVEEWPDMGLKKPLLSVRKDGENRVSKVASFNSRETAEWFCEILEEFFL